MTYSVVENFLGGVDRTRPIYASAPGTLYEGINGHLSRGGDFEKRKAFVEYAALPAGTLGMERASESLYVFGSAAAPSMPAGVIYQRLQHPDGYALTAVLSTEVVQGKIYAVGRFSDNSVIHFYDGAVVTDWVNGVVRAAMTNTNGIAAHLQGLIDPDAAYVATVVGSVITIEAAVAGTPFTISKGTQNVAGGVDDQAIALAEVTANIPGVAEVLAIGRFTVTAGTSNPGTNKVTSVKVNGIEILNVAVDWATSHSGTATNIATQINAYASTPEYSASASGATVTISAAAGTGATPNGYTVAVVIGGDVIVGSIVNMAGGVTAVTGQKQKWTATISGTFEVGDRFTITIDAKKFGAEANPTPVATVVKLHDRKLYAGAGRITHFSGVDTATGWNRDDNPGAGFIDASLHESDSQVVTAFGKYTSRLGIISENAVQIWQMQADDDLNNLDQVVAETGTRAPRSVRSYGQLDLFYLSESGIRSLRARESLDIAGVNDVGTPIDPLVLSQMAGLSDAQISAACAVVDPADGRFWLALGDKVFVFTYFPSKKVSGWSWYEPGLSFTEMVSLNRRVYCRAGDKIYRYGGSNGQTYDSCRVTCWLPFFTAKKPGTFKQLVGCDIGASGTWDYRMYVNPNDLNEYVDMGKLTGVTFPLDDVGAMGHVTHFAPYLVNEEAGAASLSAVAMYYFGGDSEG